MYRHFKRSAKSDKIEMYIKQNCTLGDWFVLYQLSKNLNKPFFMEFLSKLPEAINFRGVVFQATGVKPLDAKDACSMINDKDDDKKDKNTLENNFIKVDELPKEYF